MNQTARQTQGQHENRFLRKPRPPFFARIFVLSLALLLLFCGCKGNGNGGKPTMPMFDLYLKGEHEIPLNEPFVIDFGVALPKEEEDYYEQLGRETIFKIAAEGFLIQNEKDLYQKSYVDETFLRDENDLPRVMETIEFQNVSLTEGSNGTIAITVVNCQEVKPDHSYDAIRGSVLYLSYHVSDETIHLELNQRSVYSIWRVGDWIWLSRKKHGCKKNIFDFFFSPVY